MCEPSTEFIEDKDKITIIVRLFHAIRRATKRMSSLNFHRGNKKWEIEHWKRVVRGRYKQ